MKIGAQLYTVRDFTKTKESFAETIKKIADIGYECVQISAIGAEISPAEVAEICEVNNIEIAITHTPFDRIINDTEQVIADHAVMDCKYIGLGMLPWESSKHKDGYVDFVNDIKKATTAIKDAGYTFMYHNHDFEFIRFDGKTAFDYLAESLPDAGFTLDTFWVQAGGGDPAQWLEKFSGRVDVIHIKDYVIVEGERRMAEVLEGNLNWGAIFASAKTAGVKYAMVEQDDYYGKDPFECLKTSFDNVKQYLGG